MKTQRRSRYNKVDDFSTTNRYRLINDPTIKDEIELSQQVKGLANLSKYERRKSDSESSTPNSSTPASFFFKPGNNEFVLKVTHISDNATLNFFKKAEDYFKKAEDDGKIACMFKGIFWFIRKKKDT